MNRIKNFDTSLAGGSSRSCVEDLSGRSGSPDSGMASPAPALAPAAPSAELMGSSASAVDVADGSIRSSATADASGTTAENITSAASAAGPGASLNIAGHGGLSAAQAGKSVARGAGFAATVRGSLSLRYNIKACTSECACASGGPAAGWCQFPVSAGIGLPARWV